MREYRLQESKIGEAVNNDIQTFVMMAHVNSKPDMHETVAIVDPEGWRLEARVISIVTPADFDHVGQTEVLLEPTSTAVKGRIVECDNTEHPTGWKWVP